MNIIKPLFISTAILLSPVSFANDNKHEEGEKLFKSICAVCHGLDVGGMDMSKRLGPPIAGVRKHYLNVYPDEASFVGAVTSWIEKQDESKSLMPEAIQHFNIMPALSVPKGDAVKIATYIYSGDIEKPEGLDRHMGEMHKKMGMMGQHKMGQGKGMQMQKGQMGQGNRKQMQRAKMMGQMKKSMQGRLGKNTMLMQQLNLSPQQKQTMQSLIQQKQTIIKPLIKDLQQINQTIRLLNTTSPNYKQMIFSLADQKAKLVYRMVIEKGEKRMEIESILNPQQRAQFRKNRQQRFENKIRQH